LLRSKPQVARLVVSPGHRVAMASAADSSCASRRPNANPSPSAWRNASPRDRGHVDDAGDAD
jgi:hypothetical protein